MPLFSRRSSVRANSHPDLAIKLWIALGALGFLLVIMLSAVFTAVRVGEYKRYIGCANRARSDCASSFTWAVNGWSLNVPEGGQLTSDDTVQPLVEIAEPIAATSTTITADGRIKLTGEYPPQILSVKPTGMTLDKNSVYRAATGTKVQFLVGVTGAQTVTIFKQSSDGTGSSKLLALTKAKDGSFGGAWTVPAGLVGDLEVRAIAKDGSTASVLLHVASN